jgi:hypothetical protein
MLNGKIRSAIMIKLVAPKIVINPKERHFVEIKVGDLGFCFFYPLQAH